MPIQLDFSSAEEQRLKITQQQQEYISNLYRQAAKEVGKLAERAPRVPSDALRQQYLHTLQGQIEDQLKDIEGQLNSEIRSDMSSVAKATVADAKTFLKENGLPIKGAYSHVPADIVQSVASGHLYSGNWTLSKALWLHTAGTQQDVQSIVAQGITQNKSAYDIAKDLEKYVNPDARKDWEWSKVYPGTSKVVDYNAQRLARTMVSHAYQQAFVRTTQKNPFVTKYKWEASNSDRMCEICQERDGKLFDKDDFPLDHPNGMCTFIAVMDNLDTIGERLGDWAAGKEDPELDKWAEDLYGKGWKQKKPENGSYGVTGKDITETWERRPDQFDFEIDDVLNQQGFDGMPIVCQKTEFDEAASKSPFVGFRGYGAPNKECLNLYQESLYSGKWYVDCSVGKALYGQGMYVQAAFPGVSNFNQMLDTSRSIAEGYGRGHGSEFVVEKLCMLPNSKGVTLFEYTPEGMKQSQFFKEFLQLKSQGLESDMGVYAAKNGYDYILSIDNKEFTQEIVVLNRTKLVIEDGRN